MLAGVELMGCKDCGAVVVSRAHLVAKGCGEQLPLFAETYTCGAIQLWGLIEGDGVARSCPAPVAEVVIAAKWDDA